MNAFTLKLIALFFMLLEHAGRYLPELFPEHFPLYFEYLGRIVAPIFFFLSVESFFKTRDKKRYIVRLYTWAGIMLLGNLLVGQLIKTIIQPQTYFFNPGQNIFLSIAFGISMVASFEMARNANHEDKKKLWGGYSLAFLFMILSLVSESSYNGLLMYLVFYFFYDKKPILYYAYAGISLFFLLWGLNNIKYFWVFEFQWMMITALPLIILYNGERGRYGLKYLFYAIYPLHIWILYSLGYLLRLNGS